MGSSSSGDDLSSGEAEAAATLEAELAAVDVGLYRLRVPGQLVAVYLVYCVPLFVVGVAGWMFHYWPSKSQQRTLLTAAPAVPSLLHLVAAFRG